MTTRNIARKQRAQWLALLLLVLTAVALWRQRLRPEPHYEAYSLVRLEAAARRDPTRSSLQRTLGERWLSLGNGAAAHTAFARALDHDASDERIWLGFASTCSGAGANQEAIRALQYFSKLNPGSWRVRLALARRLRSVGAHPEALVEAEAAARLAPKDVEVWRCVGSERAERGDYTGATDAFGRALQVDPNDWRARVGLAEALYAAQRPAEGMACLQEAARRSPAVPVTWQLLVRAATADKERAEAERGLAAAQRMPAPKPETSADTDIVALPRILSDADDLLAQHRLPEAEGAFRAALAASPESPQALEGLGLTLNDEHKDEEAFVCLEQSAELNPRMARAQATLGTWYLEATFANEAVARLSAAVAAVPDNPEYWHRLGLAQQATDVQGPQAEQSFRKATEFNPRNAAYLLDLADMLAINDKIAEAETTYRNALALAPRSADALGRLGGFLTTHRATPDRLAEADRLLREAVRLEPDNDFALFHLSQLSLERHDDRLAYESLSRAVALVPQISECWYALSRVCHRLGKRDEEAHALGNCKALLSQREARTDTSELLSRFPKDPTIRLRLARLYALNGENAKATFEYQSYLHLQPHDTRVANELAGFTAHLKREGHLPSMRIFAAMVNIVKRHETADKGSHG
jgi:predicted Zn-dependent protease